MKRKQSQRPEPVKFGKDSLKNKSNSRRQRMTSASSREIEVNLSLDNIKDQVAAFLYATKVVKDSDDFELSFDTKLLKGDKTTVPVKIKFKTEPEVKYLTFNG